MESRAPTELTIGELAAMSRLTVRALRHYDRIGLLHPARVDPGNGYRYYESNQIVTASTIAVLRRLEIDIDTISQLLTGVRDFAEVLEAERERRERDLQRAAASLAVLASLETAAPADPVIAETPRIHLIGTNLQMLAADDIAVAAEGFERLFATLSSLGLDHHSDGVCIIRRSGREQLDLDIGAQTPDHLAAPTGYRKIVIDAGRAATLVHHGPLESLPLAHAQLNGWILDQGLRSAGNVREIYLGQLTDQRTRLEIPLEE